MAAIRARFTFANVTSICALFIALGGGAYATVKANSVGSKQIKAKAVKTADLADNAVTSPKVANGSLLGADFAAGQLPRGATGPQGPTGTVDTTNFYDKAASDARFLGVADTAANSKALGGFDSSSYPLVLHDGNSVSSSARPNLGFTRISLPAPSGSTVLLSIGFLGLLRATCSDPAQPAVLWRNDQNSAEDVSIQNMITGNFNPFASVPVGGDSAVATGSGTVKAIGRFQFIVSSGATNGTNFRMAVFDVTMVTAPGGGADNSCLFQVQSQSLTSNT